MRFPKELRKHRVGGVRALEQIVGFNRLALAIEFSVFNFLHYITTKNNNIKNNHNLLYICKSARKQGLIPTNAVHYPFNLLLPSNRRQRTRISKVV